MLFKISSKKKAKKEDLELLKLYQQTGDTAYLGELYQRYTHLVIGVCMKYLRDEEDSKDAAMQIFEKLVETLPKQEIQNFKSWLHVLTKNHCLMWLRSKKQQMIRESKEFSSEGNMESAVLMHHDNEGVGLEENLQHLEKAILELPTEQKTCIELFYLQQKCYKEIVELTKYDLKKVKSYIQNGKRNLKNILSKRESFDSS